ncbi:phosphopantetheine adenylyltransferase [Candidatus Paracaedimonas acanthamoebae]|nr:phosphopantetheine adenylyltransferase [Candidatus Paracaedimonas acanthamoebae]
MSQKSPQQIAVYPGTFDPITKGHRDIIQRAALLFDKIIIAIAVNAGKNPTFSLQERFQLVQHEVEALSAEKNLNNIEVQTFDTLLVNFAKKVGARTLIRGLRAVSDFEYELQLVGMNTSLSPELETIFLMASERYQFISSSMIKEVAQLGGDVTPFVSPFVAQKFLEKTTNN